MDASLIVILVIIAVIVIIIMIVALLRYLKGTIELTLENYQFSPGEKVKGTVLLKLKKDVEANKLEVSIMAESRQPHSSFNNGKRKTEYKTENVFEFSMPIDSQKNYSVGQKKYAFNITIPKNVKPKLEGVAGTIMNALPGSNASVQWYVQAHLDAKGVDLYSKKIQINVV